MFPVQNWNNYDADVLFIRLPGGEETIMTLCEEECLLTTLSNKIFRLRWIYDEIQTRSFDSNNLAINIQDYIFLDILSIVVSSVWNIYDFSLWLNFLLLIFASFTFIIIVCRRVRDVMVCISIWIQNKTSKLFCPRLSYGFLNISIIY